MFVYKAYWCLPKGNTVAKYWQLCGFKENCTAAYTQVLTSRWEMLLVIISRRCEFKYKPSTTKDLLSQMMFKPQS